MDVKYDVTLPINPDRTLAALVSGEIGSEIKVDSIYAEFNGATNGRPKTLYFKGRDVEIEFLDRQTGQRQIVALKGGNSEKPIIVGPGISYAACLEGITLVRETEEIL